MEERELKQLVSLFEQSSLQVMEIEKKDDALRIRMEKGFAEAGSRQGTSLTSLALAPAPAKSDGLSNHVESLVRECPADIEETAVCEIAVPCETVTAPLVGTFYEAPAPGEPAFAAVGQRVEKGQTLCLIEAMKMMNELKSPVSGVVRSVGSQNGQMVEFGQVLFEIERSAGAGSGLEVEPAAARQQELVARQWEPAAAQQQEPAAARQQEAHHAEESAGGKPW